MTADQPSDRVVLALAEALMAGSEQAREKPEAAEWTMSTTKAGCKIRVALIVEPLSIRRELVEEAVNKCTCG